MRAGFLLAVALVAAGYGFVGTAIGAPSTDRYTVVPGDSLSQIASRYDISLARLSRANSLDPGKPLLIGTVLRVPDPARLQAGLGHFSTVYVVRPGDTLGAIAVQHGLSLGALAQANGIDPSGLLLAGSKLRLPPQSGPTALTITIRPGDTLSALALRYGISLDSILTANHIEVSATLLVGQRLTIPATSAATFSLAAIAGSEVSPYPAASSGLDVSYPDCAQLPAPGASFTIVGLNNGRPFTTNPCFADEYAAARTSQLRPSIYLNSAYAPSLHRHITPDCLAAANEQVAGRGQQLAYAVGCSEAEAAEAQLSGLEAGAIWIDVEPANTWSRNPALNRATITGFADTLLQQVTTPIVGVYSSAAYWDGLTGGWSSFPLPEWIATGAYEGCSNPFATGPVWLSQHATTHDLDASC
jgi:LysM repeat protein